MAEHFTSSPRDLPQDAEYAPLPSSEALLVQKVRQQARQLAEQERYRQICEERIKELDPGHSFPIIPGQLGLKPKDTRPQDTRRPTDQSKHASSARPTSELYTGIYSKFQDALKDKAALEESLRAEMLHSEEQRSYIEVLKQALEAKMDDLGITSMGYDAFTQFLSVTGSTEALRKETAKMQSAMSDNDVQFKRVSEKLAQKSEEASQLLGENGRLEAEWLQLRQTIEDQTDELVKITAEKDALLDYVDQHDDDTVRLTTELGFVRRDYEALLEGNQTIKEQVGDLQSHLNETERDAEALRTQHEKLDEEYGKTLTALNRAENELERALIRLQDQASMHDSLKEQSAHLQGQLNATESRLVASQQTLVETEGRLESTAKQLAERASQLQEAHEQRLDLKSILQTTQEQLERSQLKQQSLESELMSSVEELTTARSTYNDSVKSSTDCIERGKTQVTNLTYKLMEREREVTDLKGRVEEVTATARELTAELEHSQGELGSLSNRSLDLTSELGRTKLRYSETVDTLRLTQEQLEETQTRLKLTETQLRGCQGSLKTAEDQRQQEKLKLDKLTELLDATREITAEQGRRLDAYGEENSLTRRSLNARESQVKDLSDHNAVLKAQVHQYELKERDLKERLDRTEGELHKTAVDLQPLISKFNLKQSELVERQAQREDLAVESSQDALQASVSLSDRLQTVLQAALGQVRTTTAHLDTLQSTERILREREQDFRSQVEQLIHQRDCTEAHCYSLEGEVSALNLEVQQLRRRLTSAEEELPRLRSQISSSQGEASKARMALDNETAVLRTTEERLSLALQDKKTLEVLLGRLQGSLPSSEMQRAFAALISSHRDLDLAERESLRVEGHLKQLEGLRASADAGQEVSDFRSTLVRWKEQVRAHRVRVSALEKELDLVEASERKRYLELMDADRRYEGVKAELESRQEGTRRAYDRPY
jgi:chromosome segregation ATPase